MTDHDAMLREDDPMAIVCEDGRHQWYTVTECANCDAHREDWPTVPVSALHALIAQWRAQALQCRDHGRYACAAADFAMLSRCADAVAALLQNG